VFVALLAVSELGLQLETLLGDDHERTDLISVRLDAFELLHAPFCLVLVAVHASLGRSVISALRCRRRSRGHLIRSFQRVEGLQLLLQGRRYCWHLPIIF